MEERSVKIQLKDIEGQEKIKIAKIEGVLDTLTSPEAEKVIAPLINEKKNIIADCNGLRYVNSTGLALLLKFCIQTRKRKLGFKIINPNKLVYEIMDLSGALRLLEVYKTQEEAIDSINKERS